MSFNAFHNVFLFGNRYLDVLKLNTKGKICSKKYLNYNDIIIYLVY